MASITSACLFTPEDPQFVAWRAMGVHVIGPLLCRPCIPMWKACSFDYWATHRAIFGVCHGARLCRFGLMGSFTSNDQLDRSEPF